jgi:hypothetical protein
MTRFLLRTSFTVWCFIGFHRNPPDPISRQIGKSHIHGSLSPSIITPLSRPSLPCLPLKTPNLRWSISWSHAHNHSRVLTCPDSWARKSDVDSVVNPRTNPIFLSSNRSPGQHNYIIHQVIYDHAVAFPMVLGTHQRQGTRPAPGPPSDCLPPSALRRCGTCAPPPSGRPGRCGTPWPPGAGLVIHGERKVTCWQLFNGV